MTKASELAALDDDELENRLVESKQELFNLRFQHATGQLENTARMKTAKRDLARGLTVAKQRGIDVEGELRRQEKATTNA